MPGQFPRIKLRTNSEQKFNSHLLDKLRFLSARASHKSQWWDLEALGWFWML